MLSCKELAHAHASDYLDGHLPLRTRWGVSLHLALCRHCRRFLKQLKVVRQLLRRRERPLPRETSGDEIEAVAAKLHEFYRQQKKSSPKL